MLRIFEKLFNKKINGNLFIAMHECGHVFLSSLDSDKLEIMEVTLEPRIFSGSVDTRDMLGAHHIRHDTAKLSRLDITEKLKSKDKLNVVTTGGMCVQTFIRDGRKSLDNNIDKYSDNPLIEMDPIGCEDDMTILINNSIGVFYSDFDEFRNYIRNIFPFALKLLNINKVYKQIEKLSKKLLNKDNKSLDTIEIRTFFSQIKLQELLQSEYKAEIYQRYNSNTVVDWDDLAKRVSDEQIMTGEGISFTEQLTRDLDLHWFARFPRSNMNL